MGQIRIFQCHIADGIAIRHFFLVFVAVAVCVRNRPIADLHLHALGQGVLLLKEHGKVALYFLQGEHAVMQRGEDGGQYIGVMADLVQLETVLVMAGMEGFVVVKFVL